jgi:ring-1,2-phenylacetyl-CoA epoxidase subunit PaaB
MRRGTEPDVYEVFVRHGSARASLEWVGSVRAADPELAWHAAKEAYTRRIHCTVLWVARRTAMVFSGPEDVEPLNASDRLAYRQPGFPVQRRRERSAMVAEPSSGPGVEHDA